MYDIDKLIIVTNCESLSQSDELQTIAMRTRGMQVLDMLSITDASSLADKATVVDMLKDELYSDMYDDTLHISAKECNNGKWLVKMLAKYIAKVADSDTLVYIYKPDDKLFSKLLKEVTEIDGSIYVSKYSDAFDQDEDFDKRSIVEVMKANGLKTQNLIEDSQVSFAYFLSALIECIYSK